MGSIPIISTSGKLPPPIIGGIRCYAKLHTTMAVFGFKAHASTKREWLAHRASHSLLVELIRYAN